AAGFEGALVGKEGDIALALGLDERRQLLDAAHTRDDTFGNGQLILLEHSQSPQSSDFSNSARAARMASSMRGSLMSKGARTGPNSCPTKEAARLTTELGLPMAMQSRRGRMLRCTRQAVSRSPACQAV